MCAIVALSVMVSCEKPLMGVESDEPEGNLKVTVFEMEKTPFGSLTRVAEPASAMCKRLNFAIYTLDGTRVKQVNQTSDAAEFGTASFQLEEGDYQVVVVGHSSNGNPTMTDPSCIKFTNAQGYTDTYLCSGVVTIGAEPIPDSFENNPLAMPYLAAIIMVDPTNPPTAACAEKADFTIRTTALHT